MISLNIPMELQSFFSAIINPNICLMDILIPHIFDFGHFYLN